LGSVLVNYIVVGFALAQEHHVGHVCEIGFVEPLDLLGLLRISFFTHAYEIVQLGTFQVEFDYILEGLFRVAFGVF